MIMIEYAIDITKSMCIFLAYDYDKKYNKHY